MYITHFHPVSSEYLEAKAIVATSKPSTQILISNPILLGEPELLGEMEMSDYKSALGIYKMNLEHLVVLESKEVLKKEEKNIYEKNVKEQEPIESSSGQNQNKYGQQYKLIYGVPIMVQWQRV